MCVQSNAATCWSFERSVCMAEFRFEVCTWLTIIGTHTHTNTQNKRLCFAFTKPNHKPANLTSNHEKVNLMHFKGKHFKCATEKEKVVSPLGRRDYDSG